MSTTLPPEQLRNEDVAKAASEIAEHIIRQHAIDYHPVILKALSTALRQHAENQYTQAKSNVERIGQIVKSFAEN